MVKTISQASILLPSYLRLSVCPHLKSFNGQTFDASFFIGIQTCLAFWVTKRYGNSSLCFESNNNHLVVPKNHAKLLCLLTSTISELQVNEDFMVGCLNVESIGVKVKCRSSFRFWRKNSSRFLVLFVQRLKLAYQICSSRRLHQLSSLLFSHSSYNRAIKKRSFCFNFTPGSKQLIFSTKKISFTVTYRTTFKDNSQTENCAISVGNNEDPTTSSQLPAISTFAGSENNNGASSTGCSTAPTSQGSGLVTNSIIFC